MRITFKFFVLLATGISLFACKPLPKKIAPANLTYSNVTATYIKGTAITNNTPSSAGGAPTSYSISLALPSGLSFNTATGVISGTPTRVLAASNYTVTAANAFGSSSKTISITVNDSSPSNPQAPYGLTYSTENAIYKKGTAISANSPSSSGEAPTSYSVSPALPSGLAFNTSTGVISGTPNVGIAATNYTVTASNSAGSTTKVISITVNDAAAQAPTNLTYTTVNATYTKGTAISNNSPTSSGGAPTGYSVSPALPSGLSFNTSTGVISGNPSVTSAATNYTVTASNSAGSTTKVISIRVNDAAAQAPTNLTYTTVNATYTKGTAISNNSPSNSGGTPTGYSISPALPSGLSFNTSTGVISGNPSVTSAATNYTVTASNSAGSTTKVISITVNNSVQAPTSLTYTTVSATYTKGTAISNNSPSYAGGAPTGYSISPALPSGLSFNTSTGVISGNPSVTSAATNYTVTASNSAGSTTKVISITVNDSVQAPTSLTYTTVSATYTKGTAISNNSPSNSGGAPTSYSVSPALPSGLSFNTSTGVISGNPSVTSAATNYTVTASNSAGSTTKVISITVNDVPAQPPGITSFSPAKGVFGLALTISGSNLANATVSFSGANNIATISNTGTQLVVVIPKEAVTGNITVTTSGGSATISNYPISHPVVRGAGNAANSCQTLNADGSPYSFSLNNCTLMYNEAGVQQGGANASGNAAFTTVRYTMHYFASKLGLSGIDGSGKIPLTIVNAGHNWNQASCWFEQDWIGLGSGSTANPTDLKDTATFPEIIAHEVTHAVYHKLVGAFNYTGQSGATNEGFADFFALDSWHNQTPQTGGGAVDLNNVISWAIGYGIMRDYPELALRNIKKTHPIPSDASQATLLAAQIGTTKYYQPSHEYREVIKESGGYTYVDELVPSEEPCDSSNDDCGVHDNSTIISHLLYQISKVIGTGQGGVDKTAKLSSIVISGGYITDRPSFADVRVALNNACADYPSIFSSADCSAIRTETENNFRNPTP